MTARWYGREVRMDAHRSIITWHRLTGDCASDTICGAPHAQVTTRVREQATRCATCFAGDARDRRRASGRCADCERPAPESYRCRRCALRASRRNQARRLLGMCHCGRERKRPGTLCDGCRQANRARRDRARGGPPVRPIRCRTCGVEGHNAATCRGARAERAAAAHRARRAGAQVQLGEPR